MKLLQVKSYIHTVHILWPALAAFYVVQWIYGILLKSDNTSGTIAMVSLGVWENNNKTAPSSRCPEILITMYKHFGL